MDETLQEMAFKKLAESLGLEHPENEDVVTIMLLASTRINRLNEEIKEYEYNDGNERC
jgi:CBS domain containing-hemolysin-like protein